MKEPNVEPESDPPADTPTPAVETALVTISQHPEALVEFFERLSHHAAKLVRATSWKGSFRPELSVPFAYAGATRAVVLAAASASASSFFAFEPSAAGRARV